MAPRAHHKLNLVEVSVPVSVREGESSATEGADVSRLMKVRENTLRKLTATLTPRLIAELAAGEGEFLDLDPSMIPP